MNQSTRREFLSNTTRTIPVAGLLCGARACGAFADTDESASVVVDTHLHCFGGLDPRFPYHKRAPYRPTTTATPQHLLKCMDSAGVDFSIVVHPEPYQDDHRYLEHCLRVCGARVKGTCLFFADRPGSVEQMAPLVNRNPDRIVAARVHAYAPGRLPPFGTPELRNLWVQATELGLAVQLHFEPRYAPGFEPLIKEFRKTTVVIDHLGRPMQGTPPEHAVVVRWARFPNTVMKVSALPDRNSYPHRDVQPVIRELTGAYGAERMIYGGGFTAQATGDSYRAYRERVADALAHLSSADRARILGETAADLYGFQKK